MTVGTAALCDALFDATSQHRADPYRLYDTLRATEPVCWDETRRLWVVTRYADVAAIVRDSSAWSSNPKYVPGEAAASARQRRGAPRVLSFMDPPEHTRLRRQVNHGFTLSAVARLRPRVERVVDRLLERLDAVDGRGPVDLAAGFAHPIPVTLICDLLGVPDADRHLFDERLTELAWLFELDPTPDARRRMTEVTLQLRSYFSRLLDRRKHEAPGRDLLSALGQLDGDEDRMGRGDLITTAILVFVAGHVTSMNLIGNSILALLTNRSELERMRADPVLVKPAVEELLRFDGPVQMVFRVARSDIDVGGVRVGQGQRVALVLGSANRDPEQFEEPDRLDVTRDLPHHLAFGYGMHHCLGAALARLELDVAVGALAARFPGAELVDEPLAWQETVTNRGLKRLRVVLRP